MAEGNVLSEIFGQLNSSREITMRSLEPIRDFLWVDDAAQAVRAIAEKKITGVLNVGSGRGTSIRQLVRFAQMAYGSDQDVRGLRTDEQPSYLVLDIDNTEKAIGWIPKTRLENGVITLLNMNMKLKTK
jgi:UDP-glucose 4-epimerase